MTEKSLFDLNKKISKTGFFKLNKQKLADAKIERAKILVDLETAYKMAQELNQPLEYFINDDPIPPNNYHLPSREIELLENYRKLSDKEKKTIDIAAKTLASDYKESNSDIF